MLTARQRDVLRFLQKFLQTNQYAPSYVEIQDGCNLSSKSQVHGILTDLEKRGFINRIKHTTRAIEVLRGPDSLDRTTVPHDFAQAAP